MRDAVFSAASRAFPTFASASFTARSPDSSASSFAAASSRNLSISAISAPYFFLSLEITESLCSTWSSFLSGFSMSSPTSSSACSAISIISYLIDSRRAASESALSITPESCSRALCARSIRYEAVAPFSFSESARETMPAYFATFSISFSLTRSFSSFSSSSGSESFAESISFS